MSELSDAELEKVAGGVTPLIMTVTGIVTLGASAISAAVTQDKEGW